MGHVPIELVPVSLEDRRQVDRFIRMPWYIYRHHYPSPHWVPPLLVERRNYLNSTRNPFFKHAACAFWIASIGRRDVGRIAAVHDLDWQRVYGEPTGYFGMFESIRESVVAETLLTAATSWLRQRGLGKVLGPFDLSTNYMAGTLVEGFDSDPFVLMPYNPPYYDDLLTGYGLKKRKDLWQWSLDLMAPAPEKLVQIAGRLRQRSSVHVRNIDLTNWEAEVRRVREMYNSSWEKNWGFVPLDETEFHYIAMELKPLVRPELALVAEVDGRPVGFILTILNINPVLKKIDGQLFPFGMIHLLWHLKIRRTVDSGRTLLLGVKEGYRRRGIDALLIVETMKAGSALGAKSAEMGWTLEDNDLVNGSIAAAGGKKIKTYRIYGMDL